MINIIDPTLRILQTNQMTDSKDYVLLGQGTIRDINVQVQFGINFVSPHLREIIKILIKKEVMKERLSNFSGRRARRSKPSINFDKGILSRLGFIKGQSFTERRREFNPINMQDLKLINTFSFEGF